MLSAYHVADYCIYSNAPQKTFAVEANTMNILFAIYAIKVHKQIREQMTTIVSGGKS